MKRLANVVVESPLQDEWVLKLYINIYAEEFFNCMVIWCVFLLRQSNRKWCLRIAHPLTGPK